MKNRIRLLVTALAVAVCLATLTLATNAQMYRYVDENGAVHFTDNLLKVPEDQRPIQMKEAIAEESEGEQKTEALAPAPEKTVEAVEFPKDKIGFMEAEALFAEKEALDAEFMEIIEERDRLERERSIPGGPEEVKAYNDAVFALKDRIAAYLKRCDAYEARRKAFKEKMTAFETAIESPPAPPETKTE
ncbi:MAG: DUF4124 domain-containing protein [Deltaproteobacteria bacterium]|nr:DUF4124 domain-containing protein [Deltaproteobacteria bacterium]